MLSAGDPKVSNYTVNPSRNPSQCDPSELPCAEIAEVLQQDKPSAEGPSIWSMYLHQALSPAPAVHGLFAAARGLSNIAKRFSKDSNHTATPDIDIPDAGFGVGVGHAVGAGVDGQDGFKVGFGKQAISDERDRAENGLIAGGTFFAVLYGSVAIARSLGAAALSLAPKSFFENPLGAGQNPEA